MLESAGRLFKRSVKMYVYPTRDPASRQVHSVESAPIAPPWQHLRDLLIEIGRIERSQGGRGMITRLGTPPRNRRPLQSSDRLDEPRLYS